MRPNSLLIRRSVSAAILAALTVALATSPASAAPACIMSYCKDKAASTPAPATAWPITNESRQKVGTIYNPGHGRRLQIRNNSRQILGFVERNGTITNTRRQKVLTIEGLTD